MSAETQSERSSALLTTDKMEGQTTIKGRQDSKDDHGEHGASRPWDWPLLRAVQPGRKALPGDKVLMQPQTPWTWHLTLGR